MVYRKSLLTVVAVEELYNVTGSLRKGGEPDNYEKSHQLQSPKEVDT